MSNASGEMHKTRIISELKGFIRKLLQDPKILEQSLIVARARLKEGAEQGKNEQAVLAIIANEISDTTSIHIPEDPAEHSDADKLFLELLKDVVEEEESSEPIEGDYDGEYSLNASESTFGWSGAKIV